ncbi:MAG: DUF502 domain-containing protein [Kiloniellales bacterium]
MAKQADDRAKQAASEGDDPRKPLLSQRSTPGMKLRTYFIAGILVTAPISITLWLVWQVVTFIDSQVTPLIPPQWNPQSYVAFGIPGLGLIVALIALTLIGFLAAGYLGRLFTRLSDRLMARVPIARSLYSWTKQVFETVLSHKSTAFREVVLVEYPRRGNWAVGFITGRTEGEVQRLTEATVNNVFIPATPNPTTGFLLFIPEDDIHRLDMTVEEGLKLVISGGIVAPPAGRTRTATAGTTRAQQASDTEEVAPSKAALPHARFLARLRNYFFAGVLVTAPIGITLWVTWELIGWIDSRVLPYIPPRWNPETYLPFSVPGLGLLLAFVAITSIGLLTAGLIGRTLVRYGEALLARMPVIRSLYGTVKQIVETVLKEQSQAFRQVVMFQYPREGSWSLGFITSDTAGLIQDVAPRDPVTVFLATTPNPTSGFLLFIPREELVPLAMTVEEGVKMVVSGGIVTPPYRQEDTAAERSLDAPAA